MKVKKLRRTKGEGSIVKRGRIYYISYISRSNGKRIFESSHSSNKDDAERLLRDRLLPNNILDDKERLEFFKYQIKCKENELEKLEKERNKIRVDDLAEEYFKRGFGSDLAHNTKVLIEDTVKSFSKWIMSERKIIYVTDVSKQMCIDYGKYLKVKLLVSSYNNHISYLRTLFKCLELPDYFQSIPRLHDDGGKREPFTIDMIRKVEDFLMARGEKWKEHLMMFRLGYMTGQRESDIASIKISDINLEKNYIAFRPIKTKKFDKRVNVPMFPALRNYILEYKPTENEDGYLLPLMYRKWSTNSLTHFWKRVFKLCGFEVHIIEEGEDGTKHKRPKYTFHSLRHFFISSCLNAGCSLDYIKHLTTHTGKVILRYSHFDEDGFCQKVINQTAKEVELFRLADKSDVADDVIDVEVVSDDKVDIRMDKDVYDTVMKYKTSDDMSFSDCLKIALEEKSIK